MRTGCKVTPCRCYNYVNNAAFTHLINNFLVLAVRKKEEDGVLARATFELYIESHRITYVAVLFITSLFQTYMTHSITNTHNRCRVA